MAEIVISAIILASYKEIRLHIVAEHIAILEEATFLVYYEDDLLSVAMQLHVIVSFDEAGDNVDMRRG